MKNGLINF